MDLHPIFILVVLAVALFLIFLVDFFSGLVRKTFEDISDLLPSPKDLPGGGWRVAGGDELFAEEVAWEGAVSESPSDWGFEGGSVRVYERGKERAAFTVLKFSSKVDARRAFSGICGNREYKSTYPISMGDETLGMYNGSVGVDGIFFRIGNLLALIVIYSPDGVARRRSARYARAFTDLLT